MKKVEYFYHQNKEYYIKTLRKINEQMKHINLNKHFKNFKDNLEIALKELYKEILLMKQYIELNLKAKIKILKKYEKYSSFYQEKLEVSEIINEYFKNSKMKDSLKEISDLMIELEKTFNTNYFDKYNFHCGKVLKDYSNPIYFTQKQSFYFGFFCGTLVILFIVCLLIGSYYNIDMDDDAEFKSIFPMFRGFMILCIYFWLLGLNVYTWNKSHVNYRLCFAFKNHYSNVISIFRRAAAFSTFYVITILCYMISRTQMPLMSNLINFIPLEITPLLSWIILVMYMFNPLNYMNKEGRMYFFKILVESCASIFVKSEFKYVWFTDQLTSMVGPIRDIEYTFCYYTHYINTFEERKNTCSNKRSVILVIAIFPHVLRTLQCIRAIYDSKKIFPQIINAGKYLIAILVAVTSFSASNYLVFNNVWWLFALISTIYSYIWDLKMDFGFLEHGKNYPLREKLSYKNKCFYYFCIITNLFLRFMWVMTVSPEIVYRFIRPEFFSFIIYSLEVFRRGMWNFIRVEYKHIELCKEFKVTLDVELPFKKNEKGEFVLRNQPLIHYGKVNKRIEKIKSERNLPLVELKKTTSTPLNVGFTKSISNNNLKDDDISNDDFRKGFKTYLSKINDQTANNMNKFDYTKMQKKIKNANKKIKWSTDILYK